MNTRYCNAEDLYDLGTMLKEIHRVNLGLWKTNGNEHLKQSNRKLLDCIDDIDEICVSEGICPFCGNEIETVEIDDKVCGPTTVTRCSSCKEEF